MKDKNLRDIQQLEKILEHIKKEIQRSDELSKLGEAIFDGYCIPKVFEYSVVLEILLSKDEVDWIYWYSYEGNFGNNKHCKAGYDEVIIHIDTTEKLWDIMYLSEKDFINKYKKINEEG